MMDNLLEAKIQNVVNEIENQLANEQIDPYVARALMSLAVNRILLLTTHIGYLEERINSLTQSNKTQSTVIENMTAENQRLSQIAKY
jgi:FtsZ-binding cell division protein ZapB